jgi:hypothetical protein
LVIAAPLGGGLKLLDRGTDPNQDPLARTAIVRASSPISPPEQVPPVQAESPLALSHSHSSFAGIEFTTAPAGAPAPAPPTARGNLSGPTWDDPLLVTSLLPDLGPRRPRSPARHSVSSDLTAVVGAAGRSSDALGLTGSAPATTPVGSDAATSIPGTGLAPPSGTLAPPARFKPDFVRAPAKPQRHSVTPAPARSLAMHPETGLQVNIRPCISTGKGFTPAWNTYDGGSSASSTDAALTVATGKGVNTNVLAYAAGYHGSDGFIRSYNASTGVCASLVTLSDPAGVTVTSMAVDTQGVYVTVNLNNFSKAFVLEFAGDLSSQLNGAEVDAQAGGTVRLNGVGVQPTDACNSDTSDVFAVGGITGVSAYSDALAIRMDKTLTITTYAAVIDFGSDSEGKSVAADASFNAYIGGRVTDPSIGDSPLTFELDPTGTTSPWAYSWSYDNTYNIDPRVGDSGAVFIDSTGPALGAYFNMTMGNQASLSTGTADLSLHTIPDGSFSGAYDYSWILYSGALGDLSGTSLAVDSAGNAYLGAARSGTGTETQHAGRVYHWPLPGGVADYQQNYGTEDAGFDTQIRGVALTSTDPTGALVYGGFTTQPAGTQSPPVTGSCGITGGQDGFIAASQSGTAPSGPRPGDSGGTKADCITFAVNQVTYSGGKYFPVAQDNGTDYGTPQYLDKNGNGQFDQGDQIFPVAFTRNTTMKVSAQFTASQNVTAVWVQGTGPDGMNVAATEVKVNPPGKLITLPETAVASPFPNKVLYYNPLAIDWQISIDNKTSWVNAGTSKNRVYVTLADPTQKPLYETALDIAGRNAKGTAAEADAVAAIWKDFQDPVPGVLRKAIDGLNQKDGVEMKYWNPWSDENGCQNMSDMLQSPDGNGTCAAWANLFKATLQAEGIGGAVVSEVKADTTKVPGATGFLVKNWKFVQSISTGPDGLLNSDLNPGDKAYMAKGNGYPNTLCVSDGGDGKLDTKAPYGGDDVLVEKVDLATVPPTKIPIAIVSGANGICQTTADVKDKQEIPVGKGAPNYPGIYPGPDQKLDSAAAGDDKITDGQWALVSGANFPYVIGKDAFNLPGIPGQGQPEPPSAFENHYVVKYGGKIYDPSYGAGPFGTENDHENAAIDGFKGVTKIPMGILSLTFTGVKKQDPAVQELTYS